MPPKLNRRENSPSRDPNRDQSRDVAADIRQDPGRRLDSWKEIAAYLGRGERTVKRWEAARGLPAHRVPGRGRASVYAYTGELDEWLKSSPLREQAPEAGDGLRAAEAAESTANPLAEDPAEPEPQSVTGPQVELTLPASAPVPLLRPPVWHGARFVLACCCLVLLCAGAGLATLPPSRTYPHALSSVFAKPQPRSQPPAPPAVSDAEKAAARDLYLKGRYEWSQRTPDSQNRAVDLFTQAIVHDPGYTQAYVGLAETYNLMPEYSSVPDREAYSRAIAAAKRAVELDDSLADAHRALAFAEMYGSWDFAGAGKEFRRAIELNPKDPEARRWYANAFERPDDFAASLDQMDKALALDPTSKATLADKGLMLYLSGRRDEGIAMLKEVERSAPEFRSPHAYLMEIDLGRRDVSGYLDEGQKNAEAGNDAVLKDILASARAGYLRSGEAGFAQGLYAKQREYYAKGKLLATTLAKTCVLMGRKQEALALLEEAYAHHEVEVLSCRLFPDLRSLEGEPRYKALVSKFNFPRQPALAMAVPLAGSKDEPVQTVAVLR
jgi:tetratricopeptide (TPR) repeat protein